jgi:hypothetical protein
MSTNKTYNGWTNYATWRINLEIFDGFNILDFYPDTEPDVHEFTIFLQKYVEEILEENDNELAVSYALAFISYVNWSEIASHLIGEEK